MIHLGSHSSSLQRADCWERLYSLMVSPTYARNGWETSNVARENWRRRSHSSAAQFDNFLHESDRRRYIIGVHNVPIRPMEDNALTSPQVTQLLLAWGEGDQVARDQLVSLVYEELHRLAHSYMKRESPGHTLQTSALVNEAFVRLVDQKNVRWQNRAHFFGIAAQMMRRILVDYARKRNYAKRGGSAQQISLDEGLTVSEGRSAEVVGVHEALEQLAEFDPRKSQIVELRFFGGDRKSVV